MKKYVKALTLIMIVILSVSFLSVTASAETYSKAASINSRSAFGTRTIYIICGRSGEYFSDGGYVGYGYENKASNVLAAQAGLEKIDYYYDDANCNPGDLDGLFGYNTYIAIQYFQDFVGLSCDGIVGPDTWLELESWTNNQH